MLGNRFNIIIKIDYARLLLHNNHTTVIRWNSTRECAATSLCQGADLFAWRHSL